MRKYGLLLSHAIYLSSHHLGFSNVSLLFLNMFRWYVDVWKMLFKFMCSNSVDSLFNRAVANIASCKVFIEIGSTPKKK